MKANMKMKLTVLSIIIILKNLRKIVTLLFFLVNSIKRQDNFLKLRVKLLTVNFSNDKLYGGGRSW